MAIDEDTELTTPPLMAYNFQVSVDGLMMSVSEVSGLELASETVTYRHGMSAWEGEQLAVYHVDQYKPLTLKRGTMAAGDMSLYQWFAQGGARSMTVSLCDAHGSPTVVWQIARAVPTKLTPPSFSADGREVSVDTFELMASGISIMNP
ncbi:MAG: phage tail protein [Myxococcota bacterium]